MFQKFTKIKFLLAVCAAFLPFSLNGYAQQSQWLDIKPLPSWNARKRAVLQTKKISAAELKRCAVAVREPSLPQDFLLAKMGWTLTGAAQIFGKTAVITVAEAFDGMCRPLNFDTYVFVGNRVAGTLSPEQMNSRADGSLISVNVLTENDITAEYARYRESDALCCPYKTERVGFKVETDGETVLLVPESKLSADNESGNQSSDDKSALLNTVWLWQSLESSAGLTEVKNSENYTIEFTSEGRINVKADCNRGGGTYKTEAGKLTFSPIFSTKVGCPAGSLGSRYLNSLQSAESYRIEADSLLINLSNGDRMKFKRRASNDKTGS